MDLNRKAQGLPINTIILIAIGLLILVLFITFVLGGFKGIGGGTNPTTQAMSSFGAQCTTYCSEATPGQVPYQFCGATTSINGVLYTCLNQTAAQQTCTVPSASGGSSITYNTTLCSKA